MTWIDRPEIRIARKDGRLTAQMRGGDASLLRGVHVRYRLPVGPETDRSKIDRAMGFHAQHCGVYRSLHPQIKITTELELVEG